MKKMTEQMRVWNGEFGRAWTERCDLGIEGTDRRYLQDVGSTRSDMYREFLADVPRDIRVLEVACNIGTQLSTLERLGFRELYGVELQEYAVLKSRRFNPRLNIVRGSAFGVPFGDAFFDLVYTSVFLIHVAPADLAEVLDEIHRCSRRYIMGYEFYADTCTEVHYRGHDNLLWKTDFCRLYLDRFPELRLLRRKKYHYADGNRDEMFLLEKGGRGYSL